MSHKLKVTGKVQNSTALGIIHAYMQLNPKAKLSDLRKVFPNDVAPDKGVAELFLPVKEAEALNDKMSLYFTKEERPIVLANGTKIALSQIWSSKSLDNLIAIADKLGITAEVNKDADLKWNKSGFVIETLDKPKSGCFGLLGFLILVGAGIVYAIV